MLDEKDHKLKMVAKKHTNLLRVNFATANHKLDK